MIYAYEFPLDLPAGLSAKQYVLCRIHHVNATPFCSILLQDFCVCNIKNCNFRIFVNTFSVFLPPKVVHGISPAVHYLGGQPLKACRIQPLHACELPKCLLNASVIKVISASCPVHNLNAAAPCSTSIPSPFSVGLPRSCACCKNFVRCGT